MTQTEYRWLAAGHLGIDTPNQCPSANAGRRSRSAENECETEVDIEPGSGGMLSNERHRVSNSRLGHSEMTTTAVYGPFASWPTG
ncbi:hypothetical protein GORHZ_135_00060 [Gordonia rhizosphera NBRC 16068]|uniref:Uncharacterized protein n=1 Tax=Gordonia rhizosphera NBRC 16068 TaxID=1108045 RepID=K6WH20_9ACTN|nr:hypothetical protein GORHZ_135_00060 [Gordonia rhizosphera NBRC 16068]